MVPWEQDLVKCHRVCKPLVFPYGLSGLYSTDFKQPMAPSSCPSCQSVCVCLRVVEAGEQKRGAPLHKEGQCPGEAQPERVLLSSHAAHLKPCATKTLCSVRSCWTFPAYRCSHHRLVSTRDVAAALNISFPQRHAARIAKGTRRQIFS